MTAVTFFCLAINLNYNALIIADYSIDEANHLQCQILLMLLPLYYKMYLLFDRNDLYVLYIHDNKQYIHDNKQCWYR